jgi:hypothetical protein
MLFFSANYQSSMLRRIKRLQHRRYFRYENIKQAIVEVNWLLNSVNYSTSNLYTLCESSSFCRQYYHCFTSFLRLCLLGTRCRQRIRLITWPRWSSQTINVQSILTTGKYFDWLYHNSIHQKRNFNFNNCCRIADQFQFFLLIFYVTSVLALGFHLLAQECKLIITAVLLLHCHRVLWKSCHQQWFSTAFDR